MKKRSWIDVLIRGYSSLLISSDQAKVTDRYVFFLKSASHECVQSISKNVTSKTGKHGTNDKSLRPGVHSTHSILTETSIGCHCIWLAFGHNDRRIISSSQKHKALFEDFLI